MNDFFVRLLLGHMVGDYLFQNKWMAMNKSGTTFTCLVHCAIYTFAVWLFTCWDFSGARAVVWPVAVFLTHFPIDRWSLADKWLDLINGRSLPDFLINGWKNIPGEFDQQNYHALRGGFHAVVYTATDNTMHLVLMYAVYRALFYHVKHIV